MRFVVLTQIFWYIWVFWWGLSFLMWSEVSFDFASVLWSHIMFLFVCQGDQARNFFLQSGLPPPILAQIWWVTSTGSYNQLWNIRLKITQWWSITLWSIQIYLKLFFFFFFFSLWRALADMNSDGRMDIHEFSIAMKLIKLKLQGHPLPPSLPPSMKQPPLPLPPPGGFGKTEKNTQCYVCYIIILCLWQLTSCLPACFVW